MVIKEIVGEELKSSSDLAKEFNIAESTVRKYVNLLNDVAKQELFEFIGNKRYFNKKDIYALKLILTRKSKTNMPLHAVISSVYVECYSDMQRGDTDISAENVENLVSKEDISLLQKEVSRNNELMLEMVKEIQFLRQENSELKDLFISENGIIEQLEDTSITAESTQQAESSSGTQHASKKLKWYQKLFS